MKYIKNYSILIIIIFIALINTIFLIKKPLYNELETLDLINFINQNIESDQLIQTDLYEYEKRDLGALIRILSKQNIYHDDPFPFTLNAFGEWKKRNENINEIKKLFSKHSYKLAICSLKKLNIDYYIAPIKFDENLINEYIVFKNMEYIVIKTKDNVNC